MDNNKKKDPPYCVLCGRTLENAPFLVTGVYGRVCPDCLEGAAQYLKDIKILEKSDDSKDGKSEEKSTLDNLPRPHEIKEFLDKYVIGQDEAKEKISVAVYNHYKRLVHKDKHMDDDIEIDKSNMLILGASGSGKTMLAKTVARMLDVPFAIADATTLTEAGYVGDDVESVLVKLYQASGCDVEKTERGIVFIDEIDKIARKSDNPSITRDVSGEGVQQGLLKLLEGSEVSIPPNGGRKHPEQPLVKIDTTNILFICSGAFVGIEKRIKSRLVTNKIGFDRDKNNEKKDKEFLHDISPLDLKAFGLIPEIIGRLPVITYVDDLDEKALLRILTEPKNAIVKQYKKLLKMDNVDLEFTDGALKEIVKRTIDYKLGARGLRNTIEKVMSKAMFHLPKKDGSKESFKLVVDKKFVTKHCA